MFLEALIAVINNTQENQQKRADSYDKTWEKQLFHDPFSYFVKTYQQSTENTFNWHNYLSNFERCKQESVHYVRKLYHVSRNDF